MRHLGAYLHGYCLSHLTRAPGYDFGVLRFGGERVKCDKQASAPSKYIHMAHIIVIIMMMMIIIILLLLFRFIWDS